MYVKEHFLIDIPIMLTKLIIKVRFGKILFNVINKCKSQDQYWLQLRYISLTYTL